MIFKQLFFKLFYNSDQNNYASRMGVAFNLYHEISVENKVIKEIY